MYLPVFQVRFVTVLYSVHYHRSLESDCQPKYQYHHMILKLKSNWAFLLQSTKTFFNCKNIYFFLFDLEFSNSRGAAYVMYATQMDPDKTPKTWHTISATSRRLCYTHPLIPELDSLLGVVQHTTSKLQSRVVVLWEKQAFPATVGCTEKSLFYSILNSFYFTQYSYT